MTKEISRHDLLKVGAGTTVVAGMALAGAGAAGATDGDDKEPAFVHIHGALTGVGFELEILVSIDVAGRRDDLSGSGWDFVPTDVPPSIGACYFTQAGSIEGQVVKLSGRVLLANDPHSLDVTVLTEANRSTGEITWTFGPGPSLVGGPFIFQGSGTVVIES